ncbi:MAG: phosphohistidine phosphatase [Synechococcus sp. NAT40]|nr:phosphohistidine phosphatase [Synechococcus sp. NAT40]
MTRRYSLIRLEVATPCACVPCSTWVDLFLLRHGIAVERFAGRDHPDRSLTQRGRQRVDAVLTHLVTAGLRADRLISSPYARALETAWLAYRAGLAPEPECSSFLKPGGDHHALLPQLQGRCLLVGHEPDLSAFAAALLAAPPGLLRMRKAGFCHLRWPSTELPVVGTARLELLLRPGLLLRGAD